MGDTGDLRSCGGEVNDYMKLQSDTDKNQPSEKLTMDELVNKWAS